jgi:transposase InsO family protein
MSYAVYMSLNTALTLKALRIAIVRRQPGPRVIHYSHQAMQYAPGESVGELTGYGFRIGIAHADNPYEDAMVQSHKRWQN